MTEKIEEGQVGVTATTGMEILTDKLEYAQIIITIVQTKLNDTTSELIQQQAQFQLLKTKMPKLEKKVEIAENQLAVTTQESKEKVKALELSVKESRDGASETQQRESERKDKELADTKAHGQKRLEDAETYLKKFQRDSEQQIRNAKAGNQTEIANLKSIIADNADKDKNKHAEEIRVIQEGHQRAIANTLTQSDTFRNESKKFRNETVEIRGRLNAKIDELQNVRNDNTAQTEQLKKKVEFWVEDKKSDQSIINDYAILLDEAREKVEELERQLVDRPKRKSTKTKKTVGTSNNGK